MGVGRFGQLIGPIAVGWMLADQLSEASVFFAGAIACIVSATFVGLLAISSLRRISPRVDVPSELQQGIPESISTLNLETSPWRR